MQECYLRALRHFDTYRGPAMKPWLLAILRNVCKAEFGIERHSLTLSVITRGVTDGTSKKTLAISATSVLSPSFHLSDNKGRLSSQLKSSSAASTVLTFAASTLSLNIGAIAALPSSPSKLTPA